VNTAHSWILNQVQDDGGGEEVKAGKFMMTEEGARFVQGYGVSIA